MNFLAFLSKVHSDVGTALKIITNPEVSGLLSLIPGYGPEIVAVAGAIAALEAKLPAPTA